MNEKIDEERRFYISSLELIPALARAIFWSLTIKISVIVFCLVFLVGCHPHTKYTTYQDYTETTEWDHEKGVVKNKSSWGVRWERK